MTITIHMEGVEALNGALDDLSEDMQEAVTKVLTATGLELRGDIIKRIHRGPATGRTYKRGSIMHRASAPGEAPATDTGRLANSVTFETDGPNSVSVQSLLAYAAYLEWGTFKIAPRPAWMPAAEAARPKYIQRMEAALAGELR